MPDNDSQINWGCLGSLIGFGVVAFLVVFAFGLGIVQAVAIACFPIIFFYQHWYEER